MGGSGMSTLKLGALAVLVAGIPALGFRISKIDFPKFAGSIDCKWDGEACPGAAQGFVLSGKVGEEIPDPTAPELAAGGKVVLGFLEGKPFSWSRYSVDFPNARSKWVVLNELSSGDQNNVFLTQWKSVGEDLEFVKAYPQSFPLDLGETYVFAKALLPDNSLLLILKGEGSDAGVNLQDFRLFRLQTPDKLKEVARRTNRSEIPVQKILEKINADQPVDEVVDSALTCEIAKGKKAPSGGPLLRFIKTRTRILYTKAGPQETPAGKDTTTLDIWKSVKAGR
ncbi:MAG: hypothetical protein JWO30_4771 [Fibrobacteres bacterium]|nr:hypothetical protein [Fibrobacterota bacterium]